MQAKLEALWRTEPVRCATYLAAIVVFVAAKVGIVIDSQSLLPALLLVVPIVLSGNAARTEVTPVSNLVTDPEHYPGDAIDEPIKPARKSAATPAKKAKP